MSVELGKDPFFIIFLFNLTIYWIMEQALSNDLFGITLDDLMVGDLDFADGICLIDDNGNDAEKLLDNVTTNTSRVGLQLNVGKTKFCYNDEYQKFFVYGQELELVDEYTYLGSKTKLDGTATSEVKARIGKAAGGFNDLKKIWIFQSIKVKFYKACERSVLLYRCESWPVKECDLKSLQSFEIRCLRRCLHKAQELPRKFSSRTKKIEKSLKTDAVFNKIFRNTTFVFLRKGYQSPTVDRRKKLG